MVAAGRGVSAVQRRCFLCFLYSHAIVRKCARPCRGVVLIIAVLNAGRRQLSAAVPLGALLNEARWQAVASAVSL